MTDSEIQTDELLAAWRDSDARFRALLDGASSPALAFEQFGLELFQAGNTARAVEALAAATLLEPQNALYLGNYGTALEALGEGDRAAELFRKSLSVDENQPQTWLNLGNTLAGLHATDEAVNAFVKAAEYPETRAEASKNLGMLYWQNMRYAEAARHLADAIAAGAGTGPLNATLGASLFQLGRVAEALKAYEDASDLSPAETGYRDNRDYLKMLRGILEGSAEAAITAYARPLDDDEVLRSALSRALTFLTTFDHIDAARELVKEWLQYYDDDVEALYFQAVLNGTGLTRAPAAYVAAHFDQVAAQFNRKTAEYLDYHIPDQMAALIRRNAGKNWTGAILDAGCGIGLLGESLKPIASRLAGIDLSQEMIKKAQSIELYDRLAVGDLVEALNNLPQTLDLVAAADVLIYFGTLEPVFAAALRALKPKGMFSFSLENLDGASTDKYRLMPNGHFKHGKNYVLDVAKKTGFRFIEAMDIDLRKQAETHVPGIIFLFKKN